MPGRAEPVPTEALTWLCRAYGNASIRRAYADWADARFGRYQDALERNGIDQIQIGRGPSRENAADIRMAVARVESAAAPAAQPGFRLSDAERLLVTAMEQASNDTPTASQVEATMLALDPSFDEANYGCRGFRDLRARLDHRVRTAGRSGADITLALVVQPVQQTTQP